MKISIIIPVYNEIRTIEKIILEVLRCDTLDYKKEVIVVDDCSRDGTRELIKVLAKKLPIKAYFHRQNLGKGGGIKTGVRKMTGQVMIVQDGDLEYRPRDIVKLLKHFDPVRVPVVYGSRNMGAKRGYLATHLVGTGITWLFNLLYGTKLTDLHTGYKLFRADLVKKAKLETNGFDFCHEVTAKMVQMKMPIVEVPISYDARKWDEGKKVRAIDAWWDILTTVKLRFGNR